MASVPYLSSLTRDTPGSEWICPGISFPLGGFVELEEAFDVALEVGEAVVDGVFGIEKYEVEEGGLAGESRLRNFSAAESDCGTVPFG
jgi:hypothetical protein